MDNFSAIASLVLFGLFLITCPAEGFVTGYRYIDLSDPRLQSAPMKRQDSVSEVDEARQNEEVEEINMSSDNKVEPPTKPIYPKGYLPEEGQQLDVNGNNTQDAEKRADVPFQKTKYGHERQNNENDINASNTASISASIIVTFPSKSS